MYTYDGVCKIQNLEPLSHLLGILKTYGF